MNSPPLIRWGLVGAGDVCEKKSGPPLWQLLGHQLVAVHRRDAARGQDFARRHGPSRYAASLDELLADPEINAVYVATPADLHASQTLAALRAGKHVLVEKPMATDTAACDDMVRAAREAHRLLGVAYYRRAYPSILRAKARLEAGDLGDLHEIHFNGQFPPSHRLDLLHFLAGPLARARIQSSPEGAVLKGQTSSGTLLSMPLGWREIAGAPEQVTLIGSNASLRITDLKAGCIEGTFPEQLPGLPWTHWGLIENFGFALQGTAPLACSGEEGRKSTVILDWISTLSPDAPWQNIDYAAPPPLNRQQAAQYHLLG